MSNALYALYQRSVFDLAQTMVVKHSEVAAALNAGLAEIEWTDKVSFNTDPSVQHTWKYYKNLAGEYHSYDEWKLFKDTGHPRMQIKVAGPNGPVDADLTWQLIASDPALADEFRFGSTLYLDLIARYPDFQDLIDGIMNPIDIDIAIAAVDGELLYAGGYFRRVEAGRTQMVSVRIAGRRPPNLIEENETNLLDRLEEWIKGFLYRWHNKDYAETNDLYVTGMLGVLYAQIPKVIMNIRLDNCNTAYAHTYHIREYLASNGRLNTSTDALGKRELLWLYRNLRYLESHMGKRETFQLLVDNIATPSNIPLAGYQLRHQLTDIDDDLYAAVNMTRETINFRNAGVGTDVRSIREILDKEAPFARDGNRDLDSIQNDIDSTVKYKSMTDELMSKVIESNIVDLTDAVAFPLTDTLLDLFIYHASNDTYTANLYVTNPTSKERVLLSPKQALILMFYCFNKVYSNIELLTVPAIPARLIPRTMLPPSPTLNPRPDLAELQGMTDAAYVPAGFLQGLLDAPVITPNLTNNDAFYTYAESVNAELMGRYYSYAVIEDSIGRAMGEAAAMQLYWPRVECELSSGETYVSWLAANGVDFTGFQLDDYEKLGLEILQTATGSGESSNRVLARRQTAVIAILRYLSSYSVQFLKSIADSTRLPLAWGALRLSKVVEGDKELFDVEVSKLTVLRVNTTRIQHESVAIIGPALTYPVVAMEHEDFTVDTRLDVTVGSSIRVRMRIGLAPITALEREVTAVPLTAIVPNSTLPGFMNPGWDTMPELVPGNGLPGLNNP